MNSPNTPGTTERTAADIKAAIATALLDIAPEADLDEVEEDEPLREELDLDSMDLLNLYTKLSEALGVDIPESDYSEVATLQGMVAYLGR